MSSTQMMSRLLLDDTERRLRDGGYIFDNNSLAHFWISNIHNPKDRYESLVDLVRDKGENILVETFLPTGGSYVASYSAKKFKENCIFLEDETIVKFLKPLRYILPIAAHTV